MVLLPFRYVLGNVSIICCIILIIPICSSFSFVFSLELRPSFKSAINKIELPSFILILISLNKSRITCCLGSATIPSIFMLCLCWLHADVLPPFDSLPGFTRYRVYTHKFLSSPKNFCIIHLPCLSFSFTIHLCCIRPYIIVPTPPH